MLWVPWYIICFWYNFKKYINIHAVVWCIYRLKLLGVMMNKEKKNCQMRASRAATGRHRKWATAVTFLVLSHSWRREQTCSSLTLMKELMGWTAAQWPKLFSEEGIFCVLFGNQCARVWRKHREPQIPVWRKSVSTAKGDFREQCVRLMLIHCFFKFKIRAALYQKINK